MKLDFSKCKTKEDVDEVMRKATPEVRRLAEAFEKAFPGLSTVSGRMSSKGAGVQNVPRTLPDKP